MAEINNVIAEASQDLQTIEDFVNLPADSEVYPRLLPSVNVGTLAGARQAIFEAGGLPATPFKTKSEMESSDLGEGSYAIVTLDTQDVGLYLKSDGSWKKTDFFNKLSLSEISLHILGKSSLEIKIVDGKAVKPFSAAGSPIKTYTASIMIINVQGLDRVDVIKAQEIVSASDEWRWIVLDESMENRLAVSETTGTGEIIIPEGGAYLVRNATLNGNTDIDVKVVGYKPFDEDGMSLPKIVEDQIKIQSTVSQISNTLNLTIEKLTSSDNVVRDADFEIIQGATVKTDIRGENITKDFLAYGSDRAYFKIDVAGADSLIIENSGFKTTGLDITFVDATDTSMYTARSQQDGIFDIPDGAVYVVRTQRFPASYNYVESDAISFKLEYKTIGNAHLANFNPDILQQQVDVNTKAVMRLIKPFESITDATQKAQDIINKSDKPLYKLSSFEGTTSQQKINNALEYIGTAGKGILDLESGTHMLDEAILLPSHCWLYLNNSTIKLNDGVFDNIVRNKGIVPNPDPFKDSDTIHENKDIRIFGNGSANSFIEGQDVPKSAPSPIDGNVVTWTSDHFGWRTIGVLFANVKDFQMHDFKMQSLHSWAISLGNGCDGFDVGHIEFHNTGTNGDGVHLVVGCSNGYIHDLTGYTLDDTVGITATRNYAKEPYPDGRFVYPMAVGGWDYNDNWSIDIHDITIERIHSRGKTQAVRILVNNGAKCYNVSVNDIKTTGAGFVRTMTIETGRGTDSGWGDIYNIFINNVEDRYSETGLRLDAKIENLLVNDFRVLRNDALVIHKTSKYEGKNIKMSNIYQTSDGA